MRMMMIFEIVTIHDFKFKIRQYNNKNVCHVIEIYALWCSKLGGKFTAIICQPMCPKCFSELEAVTNKPGIIE